MTYEQRMTRKHNKLAEQRSKQDAAKLIRKFGSNVARSRGWVYENSGKITPAGRRVLKGL